LLIEVESDLIVNEDEREYLSDSSLDYDYNDPLSEEKEFSESRLQHQLTPKTSEREVKFFDDDDFKHFSKVEERTRATAKLGKEEDTKGGEDEI